MCARPRETRPHARRGLHRPPLSGSNPVPRCYYCKYTECVSFFRSGRNFTWRGRDENCSPWLHEIGPLHPSANTLLIPLRFKHLRINSGMERAWKQQVYDTLMLEPPSKGTILIILRRFYSTLHNHGRGRCYKALLNGKECSYLLSVSFYIFVYGKSKTGGKKRRRPTTEISSMNKCSSL